jgi:hypothetical protein
MQLYQQSSIVERGAARRHYGPERGRVPRCLVLEPDVDLHDHGDGGDAASSGPPAHRERGRRRQGPRTRGGPGRGGALRGGTAACRRTPRLGRRGAAACAGDRAKLVKKIVRSLMRVGSSSGKRTGRQARRSSGGGLGRRGVRLGKRSGGSRRCEGSCLRAAWRVSPRRRQAQERVCRASRDRARAATPPRRRELHTVAVPLRPRSDGRARGWSRAARAQPAERARRGVAEKVLQGYDTRLGVLKNSGGERDIGSGSFRPRLAHDGVSPA